MVRPRPCASGSVRLTSASMSYCAWGGRIASSLLSEALPRRWAHVQGVAATARTLEPILGAETDLMVAAGLLHDIGYAPGVAETGFHPLDGARYLRDTGEAPVLLCQLVAYHSGALEEAAERRLTEALSLEFRPPPPGLADAMTYCDMTTGPDGQRMPVGDRLADIQHRYAPESVVGRAIRRAEPGILAAVERVTAQLAGVQDRDGHV